MKFNFVLGNAWYKYMSQKGEVHAVPSDPTRPVDTTRPVGWIFFPAEWNIKNEKIYNVVKFCKVKAEYTGRMLKEAMQKDKDRFVLNWIVLDSSNLGIFVWWSKYIISGTLGFSDELLVQQVCHEISPAYGAPPAALPCQFQKMLPCPSKLLYEQLPDNSRLYAGGAGLLFLRWAVTSKRCQLNPSRLEQLEIRRSAPLNNVIQLE